jgi:pyruvate dehydrogenase E2 component (dihydrolipoamide acetyltransferase)
MPHGLPAISPRARRIAHDLGIDWTRLKGTGRTGRIRERDVRAALNKESTGTDRPQPLTPARRAIAAKMLSSLRATAPVTLTTMADATNLVTLRQRFKAESPAPSYTDLIVKLTAAALQEHPALNARWEDEGIVLCRGIHICFAVDTEAGLVAPVLRDVPALGVQQLAARSRGLVERARSRKLSAEEMQGGTFTVSNLGSFGIDAFTPIINHPECAILGVGRIRRQPAVIEEQIVPRDMVTLSLTFDHRIVDGAPAARFLDTLRRFIEDPAPRLGL